MAENYQAKTWNVGDVITDTALNDMENGIEKAILITAQQPNEKYNKIWINPDVTKQVPIPTIDDFPTIQKNGTTIKINGTMALPPDNLTIYGKCIQPEKPSPLSPTPIITASDDGELNIEITNENQELSTYTFPDVATYGLFGIKVNNGGNYTDENGQQWLCDTIDKATGKYTKYIGSAELSGDATTEGWAGTNGLYGIQASYWNNIKINNTAIKPSPSAPHMTNRSIGREILTSVDNDIQSGESYIDPEGRLWIYIPDSDLNAFINALRIVPMQFYFKLNTPIEIDLTTTQLDVLNSISMKNKNTIISTNTSTSVSPFIDIVTPVHINEYTDNATAKVGETAFNAFHTQNVSGHAVTFIDGADNVPIKDLFVDIKPTQEGTGTPSINNERPIHGITAITIKRSGKNLLEPCSGIGVSNSKGARLEIQTNGAIRAYGAVTAKGWISPLKNVPLASCGLAVGDIITLSAGKNGALAIRFMDSQNVQIEQSTSAYYERPVTMTIPDNTASMTYVYQFGLRQYEKNEVIDITNWFQIEKRNIFTGFEAYKTTSYEISFASAGTVYGGTFNATTGVLTVDKEVFTVDGAALGNLETENSSFHRVTYAPYSTVGISNIVFDYCDKFNCLSPDSGGSLYGVWNSRSTSSPRMFFGLPTTINTIEQAQTWFANNPTHVVAKIAEPKSYLLDPIEIRTLLGINTIYADYGDISVTYHADPNLFKDINDTKMMNELISPAYSTATVSDSVIHFDDGADHVPVKSLIVDIEPVQTGSGDPSPDNVRAISGWTGANVIRTGKNFANLSNDNLGSNQTSTFQYGNGGVVVTATGRYARAGWLIPVVNGMTYTISYDVVASDSDGMNNKVFYGSKDGVWYTSAEGYIAQTDFTTTKTTKTYTFTASSDILFFGVYVTSLATTGSATVTNLQVELNSTATPYEPYAGQTYDIAFPAEAGTVYGGKLDVTNGVLTIDRTMVTIDENTAINISTSSHRAYTNRAIGKPVSGNAVVSDTLISDYLPTVSINAIYLSNITGVAISNTGTLNFNIPGVTNGDSFTVDDVKTYLASHNLHVVCGIEPVAYQLTPTQVQTLLGTNTIFANCGDMTVAYHADPELFLNSNYVTKNDYNNTIEDLNDKDDQVGGRLLALLKKNMTDTTENGYLIKALCSYMGFKDILYFYNHKTVNINTGEIEQASEEIPGSVPAMYQTKGVTDYIDIGTQLTLKVSKDLPYNCYCYDTSKQYLGRATVNNTQSEYEIECLTNTKYIRLSFYLPGSDLDQLLRSVQGSIVVINNKKYCYVETAYNE